LIAARIKQKRASNNLLSELVQKASYKLLPTRFELETSISRKQKVKDLITLFRLRKVARTPSDPLEYRILTVGQPNHSKPQKLMAFVQFTAMLTKLLSQYLNVPLLNEIQGSASEMLAIINYNIVYICFTQNVNIPLERSTNTLDNIALLCQAPELGKIRKNGFQLEQSQVMNLMGIKEEEEEEWQWIE
jgi:hypothetical protein